MKSQHSEIERHSPEGFRSMLEKVYAREHLSPGLVEQEAVGP